MVDWPIFLLGLAAVSIVLAAVRAISREEQAARTAKPATASADRPQI